MKPPVLQHNHPLKNHNTFGIDVEAKYFYEIDRIEQLQTLAGTPEWNEKKLILGGGSNLLFTQNFDGLVIKNKLKGIAVIDEYGDDIFVKVSAGENWHQLVMYCVGHNYGGIENLSLIPGTVGAAPIQNIGAYGVELKDVLLSLNAIKLSTGELMTFKNEHCHFGYRDSIFKNSHKNQYVITDVILKLHKNHQPNTSYSSLQEMLKHMNITKPDIKIVSDAVIRIRNSKLPDPKVIGNAGSFFKNPVVDEKTFLNLQKQHPNIPHHQTDTGDVKLSAAWLVDQCGFKGKRVGSAGVHEHQALVLVNHGDAKGSEIKSLSDEIQRTVQEKFSITLTPEVGII